MPGNDQEPKVEQQYASLEQAATPVEVADGVFRLRLGLPMRLNHVNAWLLRDGDAWTLVDCGPYTRESRSIWRESLGDFLAGLPIVRIIVTHGHLDHVGNAGWVAAYHGVPAAMMTRREWDYAAAAKDLGPAGAHFTDFLATNGLPSDHVTKAYQQRLWSLSLQGELPDGLVAMTAGDSLNIGGIEWAVLTGSGHSPEHAMLFDAQRRILLAGDQVLPSITPAICLVHGMGATDDPLGDFLESCLRLKALPADTTVLPGHGDPFQSLHERLDYFQAHHQDRLTHLLAAARGLNSGYDLTLELFPKVIGTSQEWIALCETLAHVRRLEKLGRVTRHTDGSGKTLYRGI